MRFKSVTQLLDHFKDEATCRAYLENKRWHGAPACHHCGSLHVYRTNRGFKCGERKCGKKFSVLTGSIYENTKLPLRIWFAAIYLCTSSKKGISSLQAGRQLGITQKSAWFLLHRVREMLREKAPYMLNTLVSVDETYYGGKAYNKPRKIRKLLGKERYTENKAPIVGLIEKDGRVILKAVPWVTKRVVARIIDAHIEKGSIMVTDGHTFYNHLKKSPHFKHEVVNHREDEYVNKNGYHTNAIEGAFSLLKRGLYGIFHSVSHKHLQKYCDEFCARFNTRKIADDERFHLTIEKCEGRLKYKDLIK